MLLLKFVVAALTIGWSLGGGFAQLVADGCVPSLSQSQ